MPTSFTGVETGSPPSVRSPGTKDPAKFGRLPFAAATRLATPRGDDAAVIEWKCATRTMGVCDVALVEFSRRVRNGR